VAAGSWMDVLSGSVLEVAWSGNGHLKWRISSPHSWTPQFQFQSNTEISSICKCSPLSIWSLTLEDTPLFRGWISHCIECILSTKIVRVVNSSWNKTFKHRSHFPSEDCFFTSRLFRRSYYGASSAHAQRRHLSDVTTVRYITGIIWIIADDTLHSHTKMSLQSVHLTKPVCLTDV